MICLHVKLGDNKLLSSVEPTKSKQDTRNARLPFLVAISTWASLFFILFFMNGYTVRDAMFYI